MSRITRKYIGSKIVVKYQVRCSIQRNDSNILISGTAVDIPAILPPPNSMTSVQSRRNVDIAFADKDGNVAGYLIEGTVKPVPQTERLPQERVK